MIAITFALPTESSDLRRQLRESREDGHFVFGKISDRSVTILHTGVGAKNCSEHVEALLHKTRPRLVISSGFAGAVTDDLQIGDLLLAENFSDRQLLASAERILSQRKTRNAKLFTSASIVDSVEQRDEIARASGASAVDMETGRSSPFATLMAFPCCRCAQSAIRPSSRSRHHPMFCSTWSVSERTMPVCLGIY